MSQVDYAFNGTCPTGAVTGFVELAREDLLRVENKVDNVNRVTGLINATVDNVLVPLENNVNAFTLNTVQGSVLSINNHYDVANDTLKNQIFAKITEECNRVKDEVTFCFSQLENQIVELRTFIDTIKGNIEHWQGTSTFDEAIGVVLTTVCRLQDAAVKCCGNREVVPNNFFYPPYVSQSQDVVFSYPASPAYPGSSLCSDVDYVKNNMPQPDSRIGAILSDTNSIEQTSTQIDKKVIDIDQHLETTLKAILGYLTVLYGGVLKLVSDVDFEASGDEYEPFGSVANAETQGELRLFVDTVHSQEGYEGYNLWREAVVVSDETPLKYGYKSVTSGPYRDYSYEYSVPRVLKRYGPFKGVFPNVEQVYFYSEELGKILAMPWRTASGLGGSF